jgi:hypothetical protein
VTARASWQELSPVLDGIRCRGCPRVLHAGDRIFNSPPDSWCERCGEVQAARPWDVRDGQAGHVVATGMLNAEAAVQQLGLC